MSDSDNSIKYTNKSLAKELLEFCRSDSLSQDGLCEIIARHGWTTNNDSNGINYAFFIMACKNKAFDVGSLQCLLEYFPDAINTTNDKGWTPFHAACHNKNASLGIIQQLMNAAPRTFQSATIGGHTPLHILCCNHDVDENTAINIVKLLLEKCPESFHQADNKGNYPIHYASSNKSPELCSIVLNAHPGSERIRNDSGAYPLYLACIENTLDTVEYLYKLYPDAINQRTNNFYPIHGAIVGLEQRNRPGDVVEIVKFLLDCDPKVKLQKYGEQSLLRGACGRKYTDANIDAGMRIIETIYDAHPEAIEDNSFMSDINRFHSQVSSFILGELMHARQAEDHRQMTTTDEIGQLPLHRALRNNKRLGCIKLQFRGNTSAIRTVDRNGSIPLHMACQYHKSPEVVRYLIDLDPSTLRRVDDDDNSILHHACRGANYDVIIMLLKTHSNVPVWKRNAQSQLPLHLLFETNEVADRKYKEYLESIFLLLK